MLILTRKTQDSIFIELPGGGPPVEVRVLDVGAGQIKVGIQAPAGCLILRGELYHTLEANRAAADAPRAAAQRIAVQLGGTGEKK